ncbi:von Willebrand factor-like [Pseudochaenichthys georgianus]|uniref:von Willebrand factor-like n=1 Tax=Pseudochaenichthys georgianus TaxID=52239 RepID=UPI0039C0DBED
MPDFCPITCPANSHYQICSETCGSPCPGLTDTISCPATCAEGCACNEGHYFNGTGCVALDECSCYHNGRTYKVNGKKVNDPSLPGNNIFVRRDEKTVIIEQMSHFQLFYSNSQELIVTVSASIVDNLCGACDRFIAFTDTMGFSQFMIQEYMASFSAQDFPTCEL